jgi:hypothetical protein
MLALLSPLLGIFGSLLPNIVRIFERKQEIQYELQLTKIKLDAAKEQAEIQLSVENVKADVEEGKSVRDHDSSIDGGKFINALRSSIRPVITYTFFILFVAIKVSAAYVMIHAGASIPEMLRAVWDTETMSLFSTIIAFWFGSRVLEKMDSRIAKTPNYNVVSVKPVIKK